ncbi:MAG TPA: exonuclease SbcCD subunit D [Candidatus Limnocylindria bacterium]|nr:exonuclease SbcCD subunit D [Candidatus Limnocylindria bacterium]
MKFFHLSDLHLGKRVNEFSMLEDQRHILGEILRLAGEHRPDAVLVCGDVYDKPVPGVEAVKLLDWFLQSLHDLGTAVLVIAGNHDSAERVAFAAPLLRQSRVHIAQAYEGATEPLTLTDEHGDVRVWMLPFLRPSAVREYFPEREVACTRDALEAALTAMPVDPLERNVLMSHQFVTGASLSESEEISVGGLENVEAALYEAFDYVALGHIHGPQDVARDTLRYCGTPLKYSFSEARHRKSVTCVEMREKGDVRIESFPLTPLRDMREVRGTFRELCGRGVRLTDDYVRVVLTDEQDEPGAVARLREVYPNLMRLEYDNARTRAAGVVPEASGLDFKSPRDLFAELYQIQNGQEMGAAQEEYVRALFDSIREGEA